MLVATTARMAAPRADSRLLEEIAHDPAAVTIRPQTLSEAGVAERRRLGAAAERTFSSACHRATCGKEQAEQRGSPPSNIIAA